VLFLLYTIEVWKKISKRAFKEFLSWCLVFLFLSWNTILPLSPHIFSDFYRSEEAVRQDTEGMGLGLYIAKKIIERHNGQIWAESEGVGKGATFYIKLHFAK